MNGKILHFNEDSEFFIDEGCHIVEMLQSDTDQEVSIARARLEPGRTTRWHCLYSITERYVILAGQGRVEIGNLKAQTVSIGDVVFIPPGCRQRITNTGNDDLLFLAICSPPFTPKSYTDLDDEPLSV